jgi:ribosomal protein S17
MSSLWNILSPQRTGVIKIAGSGCEMFGTVVKHGLCNKTVTVRVSARNWNNKYKVFINSHKNKHVHD